jgi:plastocyanin
MRVLFTFLTASFLFTMGSFAQDHIVATSGNSFVPSELTITVGETVEFQNTGGVHNVNGSQATFPDNPEDFFSGNPSSTNWTFQHTFNTPGVYQYQCDPHAANFNMVGTITVEPAVSGTNAMILTGVADGPLPGGKPKAIEVYVTEDIADLSVYGLGSANNGQGSDDQEFTFPAESASAGTYIWITGNLVEFETYFGFAATYEDTDGASNVNGDDAVELFFNGEVVDVFGDINVDGTGEAWEYLDSWAYRLSGTQADGSTFNIGNWSFGGVDVFDGTSVNSEAVSPFPIGTYTVDGTVPVTAGNDEVTTDQNVAVTFDVSANDNGPAGTETFTVVTDVANGSLTNNGDGTFEYTPNTDFCGDDAFTYEYCVDSECAQANVAITVDCPSNSDEYDIADVTGVDAEGFPTSIGLECILTGIVYGIDLQGNDNVQFYFADATGGISLFSTDAFGYTVNEGDEVRVTGVISEFNCLTQISPSNIELLSSGNDLVEPFVVTGPFAEENESELIRLENVTLVDPSQWDTSGSFNFDVTDGVNTWAVRVDSDTDITGDAPTGALTITGLGGQFSQGSCLEGYQLLPRYSADITAYVNTNQAYLDNKVTISPNPVSDVLTINTDLEIMGIQVLDLRGSVIATDLNKEVNVSQLTSGTYILQMITAEGVATKKFIKK